MTTAMRGAGTKGQSSPRAEGRPDRMVPGAHHPQSRRPPGMRRAALAAAPLVVLALASARRGAGPRARLPAAAEEGASASPATRSPATSGRATIPTADGLVNEDRYFLQVRPRLEMNIGPVELGVGGAFNYSNEENDLPPEGLAEPLLVRDNFRSRDARLDLAYGKLDAGPGDRAGRPLLHADPVHRDDLGPRPAARRAGRRRSSSSPQGSSGRFALHGIYATGSHVFEDESDDVRGRPRAHVHVPARARASSSSGPTSSSRTSTSCSSRSAARTRGWPASSPTSTRWSTSWAASAGAASSPSSSSPTTAGTRRWTRTTRASGSPRSLGDLGVSRARAEYTYAKIDKDATVAAFNTDDFFWGTGWEGHRADLGSGTREEQLRPRHRAVAALQGQPGPRARATSG